MTVDRRRIHHQCGRLGQLRAFCHAARLKGFAEAAARLGLGAAAVSNHVRELEHGLEALLFERSGARTSLASGDETLYALAEPLVRAMDALTDRLTPGHDHSVSGRYVQPAVRRYGRRAARSRCQSGDRNRWIGGHQALCRERTGDLRNAQPLHPRNRSAFCHAARGLSPALPLPRVRAA